MNIVQNVSLKLHSTMRLGGNAAYLVDITDRSEIPEAIAWADKNSLPVMMIGGGSNIIWRDEGFPGLVLVNKILGVEEQIEDEENFYITVGAGENWDAIVGKTAERGMTGIEALSLIPGTAGATPVQNVGAYGQEIAYSLVSVQAYDNQTKQFVTIPSYDCDFAYRTSRFKVRDKGRFFITAITLHLVHKNPEPPYYNAVQNYFDQQNISQVTPQILREAVIAIRISKLPDPARVANNGSFFANPIIQEEQYTQLAADHPGMPKWPMEDGRIKIPAAWLLEQAGFKDYHDPGTGMGTWPAQPLVLVNENAQQTAQLLAFKQKIVSTIQEQFGITLEQEPELLP